ATSFAVLVHQSRAGDPYALAQSRTLAHQFHHEGRTTLDVGVQSVTPTREHHDAGTRLRRTRSECQRMSISLAGSSRSLLSPRPAEAVHHRVIAFMTRVLE